MNYEEKKPINDWVKQFNKGTPKDETCPKCGIQIYDPFTGKVKLHHVEHCKPTDLSNLGLTK